jgi:predicted PurR-regulated permease PerM
MSSYSEKLMSVSNILRAISDDKSLVLFNTIALTSGDCDILKTVLSLLVNSIIQGFLLIKAELVKRQNGKYFLTSFGKMVYDFQAKVGHAVTNYWKLKAIDSFEISAAIDGVSKDEYNRIIDTLIDNQEIKKILIAKLC